MSGVKHTPGPWAAVDQGDRLDHHGTPYVSIFGGTNGGGTVATVHNIHPGNQPGDLRTARDANARLIAAAPELLQAVNGLIEAVKFSGWHIDDRRWTSPIQKAMNLIAKLEANQ